MKGKIMSMNCGLIKCRDIYINPAHVISFNDSCKKWRSTDVTTDCSDNNDSGSSKNGKINVNCRPDKFAQAFLAAQQTGKIINITA